MPIYPSGTIIDNRYEIVQGPQEKRSLAGGMGLVYLCVDHAEDGKPVVLKTFRSELLSKRDARDRFLREGTTWIELGKHPHIVRCYKVFGAFIGPEVFFVLELIAASVGKTDASLRSWLIPNEPLPMEQALLFALHICHGMAYATTKIPGLVHRDLKPENILIGSDGQARVTDFGLAIATQNLHRDWQMDDNKSSSHIRTQLTHGIAGTPLYMAPEQWKCKPLDERTDIYAFGCILYEMICGSYAVTGRSIKELEGAHCHGQLNAIPSSVPSILKYLLHRCMALNAADRYHDWTELETDLLNTYSYIAGEPVPEIQAHGKDAPVELIAVGWSYSAIGKSYCDIGKFDVARSYFEKVLSIARQHRDRALEAAGLGNLGITYHELGDARRAIEFYEKQLDIDREIGDRYRQEHALNNLGLAYFQLGDTCRAIEFYEQVLTMARELGDWYSESFSLNNLGNAYYRLGDARRAIVFFEQSLAVARDTGDRRLEAAALGNLGSAYDDLGDISRAIEFHKQCLDIDRKIGNRQGEGTVLGNLGNAYSKLGDARSAIEFHKQSLAAAREIGDRSGEGRTLGNLGNAYSKLGDARRAIEFYKQSLAIAREIGDLHVERIALRDLGNIYADLGDARSAIEFYEQDLAIARKIGDQHSEGTALGNLGITYSKLGDAHRAIEFMEAWLVISRQIGDIADIAYGCRNLALLYRHENPSKAMDYANEAYRLFTQMGDAPYVANVQALIEMIGR